MVASRAQGSVILFALLLSSVSAVQFDVGGEEGWVVPKSKDPLFYNHWASKNRFRIGDSVRFRYEKDSVVVVATEGEYEDCKSTHPVFFSNNGNTTYRLNHAGTFYFISGVTGHCDKGQRLIVRVLAQSADSPTASPPSEVRLTGEVFSSAGFVRRSPVVSAVVRLMGSVFFFF